MEELALLIPIAALMIPMVVAPTALVTKYLRTRRELQHRERMKALEVGLPAFAASHWPAAFAAVGIGVGVPVGSFLVAWLATLTSNTGAEAFGFAMIVSIVALVQGSRLAARLAPPTDVPDHPHRANGKPPVYDPDAFDVVSRRG